MQSGNISKKMIGIQRMVLLVGIMLMIVKTIAYVITHSNVILTDALESLINVLAGALALYSLIYASRPKDKSHPYGHGKIEFLSASIEAALIISAGFIMIVKAAYNLVYPQEISSIDIGIYLTGGAGLINFILAFILIRSGKQNNSMAMEADGKHLLSDAYSTLGMIIGLGIIYFTQLFWIDNVIAILFGSLIAYTGINILRKSIPGILDASDTELLQKMIALLEKNRKELWIDLHNLRVIKYGSVYHLDCHMTLPWYLKVEDAHAEMVEMEKLIRENFGSKAEMFIHIDPCKESSCSICSVKDCDVRKSEFKERIVWEIDNVLGSEQHGD